MEQSQKAVDPEDVKGEEICKRTAEYIEEESDGNERKKLKIDDGIGEGALTCHDDVENVNEITSKIHVVENDNEKQEPVGHKDGVCEMVEHGIDYTRKKKCVLLLSYSGNGYNGMQRNPGVKTIEEDLTNALFKAKAIPEDALRNFGKMSFQRCARTDKGVSAARQVVSLKMVPSIELLPEINKHLEPQIRVFALKKVTRGFDCKSRCSSRTYEYIIPTFAFSPSFAHTTASFRITSEIKDRINEILSKYEGTNNFHNFTSGKGFAEESSKRYMLSFKIAGEPFVEKNMEFLLLRVQGQSFMQHQIRKMIGLLIAIMRNNTGEEAIRRCFREPKMDIPRAPGLGLILDQVHFKSYNDKFGNDGFHEPLEWSECEDEIADFKQKFIYSKIIETEAKTKSMMRWLNTLSSHTYSSAGMTQPSGNKEPTEEEQGNDSTNAMTEPSVTKEPPEKEQGNDSTNAVTEPSVTKEPPEEEQGNDSTNATSDISGGMTEPSVKKEPADEEQGDDSANATSDSLSTRK